MEWNYDVCLKMTRKPKIKVASAVFFFSSYMKVQRWRSRADMDIMVHDIRELVSLCLAALPCVVKACMVQHGYSDSSHKNIPDDGKESRKRMGHIPTL